MPLLMLPPLIIHCHAFSPPFFDADFLSFPCHAIIITLLLAFALDTLLPLILIDVFRCRYRHAATFSFRLRYYFSMPRQYLLFFRRLFRRRRRHAIPPFHDVTLSPLPFSLFSMLPPWRDILFFATPESHQTRRCRRHA